MRGWGVPGQISHYHQRGPAPGFRRSVQAKRSEVTYVAAANATVLAPSYR